MTYDRKYKVSKLKPRSEVNRAKIRRSTILKENFSKFNLINGYLGFVENIETEFSKFEQAAKDIKLKSTDEEWDVAKSRLMIPGQSMLDSVSSILGDLFKFKPEESFEGWWNLTDRAFSTSKKEQKEYVQLLKCVGTSEQYNEETKQDLIARLASLVIKLHSYIQSLE